MNNFVEMLKVLTEKKEEQPKCDTCKKCKATKEIKVKGKTKHLCSSCAKEYKATLKEAEETPAKAEKMDYSDKSISQLASIAKKDWGKVYYSAVPYLNAMRSLEKITDKYEADSGRSVVAYFLANATQWKGDVARNVKKELNKRLGGKK
jgi:transposase-like protein